MKKVFAILGALLLTTSLTNAADDDAVPAPVEASGAPAAKPRLRLVESAVAAPAVSSGASSSADASKTPAQELLSAVEARQVVAAQTTKSLAELAAFLSSHDKSMAAATVADQKLTGALDMLGDVLGLLGGSFNPATALDAMQAMKVGDQAIYVGATPIMADGSVLVLGEHPKGLKTVVEISVYNEKDNPLTWMYEGGSGRGKKVNTAETPAGEYPDMVKFEDGTILIPQDSGAFSEANVAALGSRTVQVNLGAAKTASVLAYVLGEDRHEVSIGTSPAVMVGLLKKVPAEHDLYGELLGSARAQVESDVAEVRKALEGVRTFLEAGNAKLDEVHATLSSL